MARDGKKGRPKGRGKKIGITISHDLDALFDEFSELSGKPKATLITDYLTFLEPHLKQNIDLYRKFKENKVNLHEVRRYFIDMLVVHNENFTEALREINSN